MSNKKHPRGVPLSLFTLTALSVDQVVIKELRGVSSHFYSKQYTPLDYLY